MRRPWKTVVVTLVLSLLFAAFPGSASSAPAEEPPTTKALMTDCHHPAFTYSNCTDVHGAADWVDTVRGTQSVPVCESVYGHFQVYIVYANQWKWEWSGPDFVTKTDCLSSRVWEASRWLEVNGSYPGAHVCSRFWVKEGDHYVKAVEGVDPCVQMGW